jgi:hypothetical protein
VAACHCCVKRGASFKEMDDVRNYYSRGVQHYMDDNVNAPMTQYIAFAPNFVVNDSKII